MLHPRPGNASTASSMVASRHEESTNRESTYCPDRTRHSAGHPLQESTVPQRHVPVLGGKSDSSRYDPKKREPRCHLVSTHLANHSPGWSSGGWVKTQVWVSP